MIYLSFFKRIPQHEIGRQYRRDHQHSGLPYPKSPYSVKRKWRNGI